MNQTKPNIALLSICCSGIGTIHIVKTQLIPAVFGATVVGYNNNNNNNNNQ